MVLTGGQTYFFIFCVTVIVCTAFESVFKYLRVRKMNSPCHALRELQQEVRALKMMIKRRNVDARRSA